MGKAYHADPDSGPVRRWRVDMGGWIQAVSNEKGAIVGAIFRDTARFEYGQDADAHRTEQSKSPSSMLSKQSHRSLHSRRQEGYGIYRFEVGRGTVE